MAAKGYLGYCDHTSKMICIEDGSSYKDDIDVSDKIEVLLKQTLRHEMIHCFLHESGLDFSSDWAKNEEMVDWFALQFPKLLKAMALHNTL